MFDPIGAGRPNVRQMRKLMLLLPTHECSECRKGYVLPESMTEGKQTLTCDCGARTLLDLAAELADMRIQKKIDDIFEE